MNRVVALRIASLLCIGGSVVAAASEFGGGVPIRCVTPDRYVGARRPIDLVICLDTSGSMTGLIDSARARLWDIVNELARARPLPQLRVGLLTYGSPHVSSRAAGWVVRQIDLTDDLDSIYGRMMALTTNGGDEYVGWVLNDALKTMNWSHDPAALKLIYVAGNESADQASEQFNFRYVAEQARQAGITINAIYAGNSQQGISEKWNEVAMHGSGVFAAIDMNKATIQVCTPYDDLLRDLNRKLNDTYISYGAEGERGRANQLEQDRNAGTMGEQSMASRAAAKASGLYSNEAWDLVDASKDDRRKVASLPAAALPAEMQPMSAEERVAYVDKMSAQRADIQRQIAEANEKRSDFLKQKAEESNDGTTGLDEALLDSLRQQAKAKGFEF